MPSLPALDDITPDLGWRWAPAAKSLPNAILAYHAQGFWFRTAAKNWSVTSRDS